jgi:hypothetical protein
MFEGKIALQTLILIKIFSNFIWKKLFGGTVPPNNTQFGGTVPPNNMQFGGTLKK